MILRCILLVFIIACKSNAMWSQEIDSLRSLFEELPRGIEKHKVAIEIAEFFDERQASTDSIIKYTKGFEEFVQNDPKHPLVPITKYYILSSHYNRDSLAFISEGIQLIEETKQAKNYAIVGKTTTLLGRKYKDLSGFAQGIKVLEDELVFIENQQDTLSVYYKARICSLLSSLCSSQGNLLKALEYGLKVQALAEQISDDNLLLRSYSNLGKIYGTLSSEEKNLHQKQIERDIGN